MSTNKFHICFVIFFTLYSFKVVAQNSYQLGLIPSINYNNKVKNNWEFNYRAETRNVFLKGIYNNDFDAGYNYVLTDLSFIAAKKILLNNKISGGYLIRFREGNLIHRSIQQYTIVKKLTSYRLAHRFVTDQTFSNIESPEFRLRYRLTTEIPLNGQSADPKELYLKINNEYLNSVQNNEYDLEIRLVPLLGFYVSKKHKLEFGLDYRINSFINNYSKSNYWTTINWFIEM